VAVLFHSYPSSSSSSSYHHHLPLNIQQILILGQSEVGGIRAASHAMGLAIMVVPKGQYLQAGFRYFIWVLEGEGEGEEEEEERGGEGIGGGGVVVVVRE